MRRVRGTIGGGSRLVGSALAAVLAACSGSPVEPEMQTRPGLQCVDDSPACIERRQTALKSLMADRERRWIKEPATPEAYASGVRLFAFKGRKKELSCDELTRGRREADAAPGVLRGRDAAGLTPAQISRGAMLAAEVSKELASEMQRRCRA